MSWSEYDRYLVAAASYRAQHLEQRKGQAYFNTLASEYPAVAGPIWGEVAVDGRDPFHRDENLPAFLEYVRSCLADA